MIVGQAFCLSAKINRPSAVLIILCRNTRGHQLDSLAPLAKDKMPDCSVALLKGVLCRYTYTILTWIK